MDRQALMHACYLSARRPHGWRWGGSWEASARLLSKGPSPSLLDLCSLWRPANPSQPYRTPNMRAKGALAALLAALLVASWACCARELQGELESSQLLGGAAADGSGRSLAEAAPAPPAGAPHSAVAFMVFAAGLDSLLWAGARLLLPAPALAAPVHFIAGRRSMLARPWAEPCHSSRLNPPFKCCAVRAGPSAGGALPTGVGATFGQSGLWAT